MYRYITNTDMWITIGKASVKILFIYIVARILVKVLLGSINRIFQQRGKFQVDERRMETMRSLASNVVTYVIYFVAILSILTQLGFNLAPVLASAGVVGLAVGFGAQNLVRDVITGFFIIFEDQFAVGDYVTTGNFTGTVQEIGLRITKIKSITGEVHIIPNGSITEVTNFSTQNSVAVLDISVAYEEDVERVVGILKEELEKAPMEIEELIGVPNVLGVQNFGASEVVIRLTADCKPMGHFSANRKLRAMIKRIFDERGIEIPYPRLVTIPNPKEKV
ncbi:mechanosensitive ion channel family protein [Ammoniphilus sp. CFH 90114]|nr:mechanosensitive ion channel family protein [Ammoniphilus sp. CFH 90114]RXT09119.1 mechanosensitive ion channel family protein [Ammoniphilus sp. CFH 90114]